MLRSLSRFCDFYLQQDASCIHTIARAPARSPLSLSVPDPVPIDSKHVRHQQERSAMIPSQIDCTALKLPRLRDWFEERRQWPPRGAYGVVVLGRRRNVHRPFLCTERCRIGYSEGRADRNPYITDWDAAAQQDRSVPKKLVICTALRSHRLASCFSGRQESTDTLLHSSLRAWPVRSPSWRCCTNTAVVHRDDGLERGLVLSTSHINVRSDHVSLPHVAPDKTKGSSPRRGAAGLHILHHETTFAIVCSSGGGTKPLILTDDMDDCWRFERVLHHTQDCCFLSIVSADERRWIGIGISTRERVSRLPSAKPGRTRFPPRGAAACPESTSLVEHSECRIRRRGA